MSGKMHRTTSLCYKRISLHFLISPSPYISWRTSWRYKVSLCRIRRGLSPSRPHANGEHCVTPAQAAVKETIQTLTLFETKNFATLLKTKRPFKLQDHLSSQEAPASSSNYTPTTEFDLLLISFFFSYKTSTKCKTF